MSLALRWQLPAGAQCTCQVAASGGLRAGGTGLPAGAAAAALTDGRLSSARDPPAGAQGGGCQLAASRKPRGTPPTAALPGGTTLPGDGPGGEPDVPAVRQAGKLQERAAQLGASALLVAVSVMLLLVAKKRHPWSHLLRGVGEHPASIAAAESSSGCSGVQLVSWRSHTEFRAQRRKSRGFKSNAFVRSAAMRAWPAVVRINTERGSGFVLDGRRGLVVTSAHVVRAAKAVKVILADGRVLEGVVKGADYVTELAIVEIKHLEKGSALPELRLGDSRRVELGDWAISLGSPFGLEHTLSLGVISHLRRTASELGIPHKRVDFFQTDCGLNPGNSGGPLLNEFGEVIGITTAIRADAQGIGFAVPINDAMTILPLLAQGQHVRHPYLGIKGMSIKKGGSIAALGGDGPPEVAQASGVLILEVTEESPADAAHLDVGDILMALNGSSLRDVQQLSHLIGQIGPGQMLKLLLSRMTEEGAVELEVACRVGDLADGAENAVAEMEQKKQGIVTPTHIFRAT